MLKNLTNIHIFLPFCKIINLTFKYNLELIYQNQSFCLSKSAASPFVYEQNWTGRTRIERKNNGFF